MEMCDVLLRGKHYFRKHGFEKTASRLCTELKRRVLFHREVVYWMDLLNWVPVSDSITGAPVVLSIHSAADTPEGLRASLAEEYPPQIVNRNIDNRFKQSATLWCLKDGSEFLGYTWTIAGKTLVPYYLPITPRDVHIFDNLIFPSYRGRHLNSNLMTHVLNALKSAGFQRAYIETAEWNTPEQRSLDRIGFRRLGYAMRWRRNGRTLSV
jgi:ribosomal protein S18 acetylase RimI-like enzyme